MKRSTKETIEFLDFAFDVADAVQASLADDGKITLKDAPKFLNSIWKMPAAIGGMQDIPKELADLEPAERAEILAFAKRRFSLPDEELEVLIEQTLESGWGFAENIRDLVKYRKPVAEAA